MQFLITAKLLSDDWLFLMISHYLLKKNYAEFGKFIYLQKKEKNRKRISRAALGCPEE